MKSGIVMFVIAFVFAIYPEILLTVPVVADPASAAIGSVRFLPGYDGTTGWSALGLLLFRLILALCALSAALAGFYLRKLNWFEVCVRLALFACLVMKSEFIYVPAMAAAAGLIAHEHLLSERNSPRRN